MYIVSDEKYLSPYETDRASIIRSLIPRGDGKRALDLGCGSGFYSRLLVEKGWQVTAVDAERQNVTAARRFAQHGIVGDVITVLDGLRHNSFDLVLALELIEHLTNGDLLPRKVLELLRSKGQLIISTPNRLSPEGLRGYYWGEKIRGWGKWKAWDATHVKIYSSFEFLRLLRRTGWASEKVIGYYYRGSLPFGIPWSVPLTSTSWSPLNRLGFNLIVVCQPKANGKLTEILS